MSLGVALGVALGESLGVALGVSLPKGEIGRNANGGTSEQKSTGDSALASFEADPDGDGDGAPPARPGTPFARLADAVDAPCPGLLHLPS